MDTQQNQMPPDMEKLKEIPKWTRRYAENRSLTLLVLVGMIMFLSVVIAAPLGFGMAAFARGKMILGSVCIAVPAALYVAFAVWFIRKFGGKNRGLLDQLIDNRIYSNEGAVSLAKPESSKKKRWAELTMCVVFFILFFWTMYMSTKSEHFIPVKYVQPITALFIIPYVIIGWYFFKSPRMGPIYLLFPILYAIHAILIVAGVPIFFRLAPLWGFVLNVFLPFQVYGILPFIIGHFYGRYALKKLKAVTHSDGDLPDGI